MKRACLLYFNSFLLNKTTYTKTVFRIKSKTKSREQDPEWHSGSLFADYLHASVFSLDTVPAPFRCVRVNELALKASFKEPC